MRRLGLADVALVGALNVEPPPEFTYWMFYGTANDGGDWGIQFNRLQLRDTVGGIDIPPTVAGSSAGTGIGPERLFGGDNDTTWRGGDPPAWAYYQFTEPYSIVQYVIRANSSHADLSPSAWTIEASNDGDNWTVMDTRTGETGWGNNMERTYLIG